MTNPEIFYIAEGITENAMSDIAKYMTCRDLDVDRAFRGLGGISYTTPTHLDSVKEVTHSFNEAARHAQNLTRSISRMTESQKRELVVAGCVTFFQIEHLADVLAQDATSLKEWSRTRIRTGGRNPAAYAISEAMRRLFRQQRLDITFGQYPEGGPSTNFGKAVQFALGSFGEKSDWRRPTEEARNKQREINQRFAAIQALKPSKVYLPKPDNVKIDHKKHATGKSYDFTITDRPEVPEHTVCECRFKSGVEVQDYAARWLSEINANS